MIETIRSSKPNEEIKLPNNDPQEPFLSNERIKVNFRPELSEIIKESRYLDRMGFVIPEAALNVALQEEKYYNLVESLQAMLNNLYSVVDLLNDAEKKLLAANLNEIRRIIKPGLSRLNWNSLGIPEYLVKCNQEINKVSSLVNQIRKNSSNIKHIIDQISQCILVKEPSEDEIMDVIEFFDMNNKHRAQCVESLVQKYNSIGPLLIKMESLVANTNTGRSKMLKEYYAYWESRVFWAINYLIINNMQIMESLLIFSQKKVKRVPAAKIFKPRHAPLFKVQAILSAPEIVTVPAAPDIYKLMVKLTRGLVDTSKQFHRWQNGSCIITPPQKVSDEDEPFIFSFYSDVVNNQVILNLVSNLNNAMSKSFLSLGRYLDTWRKYRPLWKVDKAITLEKFAQKKPNVINYDDKLVFYSKLAKDVEAQLSTKDIDFIRVNTTPLQAAIHSEASSWIFSIGCHLHQVCKDGFDTISSRIATHRNNLSKVPTDLNELTFVLNTIAEIWATSEDTERQYLEVAESYRTLLMYKIDLDKGEVSGAYSLAGQWEELLEDSKKVDNSLVPIKIKFAESTQDQVKDFKVELKKMKEEFITSGPGVVSSDLEQGLTILQQYKTTLAELFIKREALVKAEKLFNLTITSYNELHEVDAEIKELEKIYELYVDVREAINQWAKALWVNIDFASLTKGMDNFAARLKKLPKELKLLQPFNVVAEKILSFQVAIPLFNDLKNDALRERHWKKLMEITGQTFDMNPEIFTLEKLFLMNLSTHSEAIGEMVGGAMKELSIENALREIEHNWKNLRFTVLKYSKGADDRGYILGSIDEITTALDDNAMSLQSMNASKFVLAFASNVQQWEKILSHIGEVIEVWMVVQRKWMYLESIFIGSGDIRMQLPDEATRFDRIDKTFKKIMADTVKHNLVVEACGVENRLETLRSLSDDLESCQKSLSDYLEAKRNAFPRFFFISDEELLSILGSLDPKNVQGSVYINIRAYHQNV
jgi:dynein heavy chain